MDRTPFASCAVLNCSGFLDSFDELVEQPVVACTDLVESGSAAANRSPPRCRLVPILTGCGLYRTLWHLTTFCKMVVQPPSCKDMASVSRSEVRAETVLDVEVPLAPVRTSFWG